MSSEPQLPDPQLSATPLIDVMLVLLIMLIMTLPIATHAVN
jgi:biopolymer transport protein ExbD